MLEKIRDSATGGERESGSKWGWWPRQDCKLREKLQDSLAQGSVGSDLHGITPIAMCTKNWREWQWKQADWLGDAGGLDWAVEMRMKWSLLAYILVVSIDKGLGLYKSGDGGKGGIKSNL